MIYMATPWHKNPCPRKKYIIFTLCIPNCHLPSGISLTNLINLAHFYYIQFVWYLLGSTEDDFLKSGTFPPNDLNFQTLAQEPLPGGNDIDTPFLDHFNYIKESILFLSMPIIRKEHFFLRKQINFTILTPKSLPLGLQGAIYCFISPKPTVAIYQIWLRPWEKNFNARNTTGDAWQRTPIYSNTSPEWLKWHINLTDVSWAVVAYEFSASN